LVVAEAMHAAIAADALRIPWVATSLYDHVATLKWLDWCESLSLLYSPVSGRRDSTPASFAELLRRAAAATPFLSRDAVIPFTERDGIYDGPPLDDEHGIAEVQRLRTAGAAHLAFAWNVFWWFDEYPQFARYLHHTHACTLRSDDVLIFDLRSVLP
jgi:hypothetical protein